MSQLPTFIFDENIAPAIVKSISKTLCLAKDVQQAKLEHVIAFQRELKFDGQGCWDEIWIPFAASEGCYIIASDKGRRGGKRKGEKLPKLCVEYGITHFLLSAGMANRPMFEKAVSILSVWNEILEFATTSQKGSRFAIEPLGSSHAKIIDRSVPIPDKTLPPGGLLFNK